MKIAIKAEPRSVQGTGASRRLRRESKVPGVLYGAGKDALPIQLDQRTSGSSSRWKPSTRRS